MRAESALKLQRSQYLTQRPRRRKARKGMQMKGKEELVRAPDGQWAELFASLRSLRLSVKSESVGRLQPNSCSGPFTLLTIVLLLMILSGCQSPRQFWDSLKGDGFPEWSGQMAGGMRGKSSDVKPSGFFTDRRSEQIEQNLGGGF